MRRWIVSGFGILLCILGVALSRPAMDTADFTGEWYSSADQSIYLFQEGILYCAKHGIPLSEETSISGAYTFSRDSIFLFAKGIPGMEREKELYLVRKDGGSFLCENRDGTGPVYFIRSEK